MFNKCIDIPIQIILAVCFSIGVMAANINIENNYPSPVKVRPFAEYENVGFLVMSAKPFFDGAFQKSILTNLHKDVSVILYSTDKEDLIFAEELWGELAKTIKIYYLLLPANTKTSKGISFFAADGMPYPVISKINGSTTTNYFSLVDIQYRLGFEPDSIIASVFGVNRIVAPYMFEYGNFMANEEGKCFIINRPQDNNIPDSFFLNDLGCKNLYRLPHLSIEVPGQKKVSLGMGHIDERAKFINKNTVITDSPEYYKAFQSAGIKNITIFPRPKFNKDNTFRTYMNARLINGVAFVPMFGETNDAVVKGKFEKLGFKVVGLDSVYASDYGKGSVHCATATYPQLDEKSKLNFYTN